jgi:hypothetical protein
MFEMVVYLAISATAATHRYERKGLAFQTKEVCETYVANNGKLDILTLLIQLGKDDPTFDQFEARVKPACELINRA